MKRKLICLMLQVFIYITPVSATIITTELSNVGGNSWQAEYTVDNNTLGSNIEEFIIWFDLGLYNNISIVSAPIGWDALTIQPDPMLPDDGSYDMLALNLGISSGDFLDGFNITFDWLGGNASMSQYFEIIDPNTWSIIDSGQTTIATTAVPEPSSMMLLAFGVMGVFGFKKKRLFKIKGEK
jgi:hypothetical protein